MKFEDLLMQPSVERQKRLQLEEEVEKLQEELDGELKLNKVLQYALQGPIHSCPCLSSLLPIKVQVLLAELAMAEEEITWLERKIEDLKMSLYREQKHTQKLEMLELRPRWRHEQERRLLRGKKIQTELKDVEQLSTSHNSNEDHRKNKAIRERRASLGSGFDIQSMSSATSNEEMGENSRCHRRSSRNYTYIDLETIVENPNKLSEELIQCLIGIYLKLNRVSLDSKKHILPGMNSKGFMSKTSSISKAPAFSFDDNISSLDPYGIQPDFEGTIRDVGPYKNFIHITRSSLDTSRVSECYPAMGKLRPLMHKLCNADLTFLTYKQKLAFWINIYNACIMHVLHFYNMDCLPHRRNC